MSSPARPAEGPEQHPLLPGATPAVIRAWLDKDDQDRFLAEYNAALDEARESLDLGGVHSVVEQWRRIAVLQTDPAGWRRTVRFGAELATGEVPPEDEPLAVTRARAGI